MVNYFKAPKESIIYEDQILYIFLAKYPVTKGHTIVAIKKNISDLSQLRDREYDYLMDTVFTARDALMKTLGLKKVYLVYMDEAKHVHWHLIPRYKEKGFDVFKKESSAIKEFSLADKIRKNLMF